MLDAARNSSDESKLQQMRREIVVGKAVKLIDWLTKLRPVIGESDLPVTIAHSPDFRSVRWADEEFSFTVNQAPVVRLLHENWQSGTPDVGDETLLSEVDPEAPPARLSVLFRDHPAWGTLIVSGGTKGSHRFTDPS
jgi:hypothetical protein